MKKILVERAVNISSFDFFTLVNSIFFLLMCAFVYYDRFIAYRGAANIHEFFIYAVVIFLVIVFLWCKFRHTKVNNAILILIEIGILLHFSGAFIEVDGHRLYDSRFFDIRYDKFVHFFNSMIALFITLYIFSREGLAHSKLTVALAVLSVLGLGGLVEVVEFLVTLTVEHHGVGDYNNNMFDLIANFLGALVGVLIFAYHLKGAGRDEGFNRSK